MPLPVDTTASEEHTDPRPKGNTGTRRRRGLAATQLHAGVIPAARTAGYWISAPEAERLSLIASRLTFAQAHTRLSAVRLVIPAMLTRLLAVTCTLRGSVRPLLVGGG